MSSDTYPIEESCLNPLPFNLGRQMPLLLFLIPGEENEARSRSLR